MSSFVVGEKRYVSSTNTALQVIIAIRKKSLHISKAFYADYRPCYATAYSWYSSKPQFSFLYSKQWSWLSPNVKTIDYSIKQLKYLVLCHALSEETKQNFSNSLPLLQKLGSFYFYASCYADNIFYQLSTKEVVVLQGKNGFTSKDVELQSLSMTGPVVSWIRETNGSMKPLSKLLVSSRGQWLFVFTSKLKPKLQAVFFS